MSTMGRPEDERVKIPALVHLTRLDYEYVSLKKGIAYEGDTNILRFILKRDLVVSEEGSKWLLAYAECSDDCRFSMLF